MEELKPKKAAEIVGTLLFGLVFFASLALDLRYLVQPRSVTDLSGLEKGEALSLIKPTILGKPTLFQMSAGAYESEREAISRSLNAPLPKVDCDEVIHYSGASTLIYLFIKDGKVVRMAERGT